VFVSIKLELPNCVMYSIDVFHLSLTCGYEHRACQIAIDYWVRFNGFNSTVGLNVWICMHCHLVNMHCQLPIRLIEEYYWGRKIRSRNFFYFLLPLTIWFRDDFVNSSFVNLIQMRMYYIWMVCPYIFVIID
jgi:hypothetical protein